MKTSHEMAQSVLKRQKKILRRRSNIITALGATGGTFAIIAAFALIFSLGWLREAQPDVTAATTNITSAPTSETAPLEEKTDPLSILQYRTNEEGEREVYVNPEEWEKIYDFDLFRKYFFGTWEITEGQSIELSDMGESLPFIIDDSDKSFFSTSYWYRLHKGYFYRIGENILAFALSNKDSVHFFWIDIDSSETMYNFWFKESVDGSLSRSINRHSSAYIYSKSDTPVNEPQNGYLSIFRLYEIAGEYGIDFDMLVKFQYEAALENSPDYMVDTVDLLHDDCLQSYPVYLVSEETNKLILKTTVGNFYTRDVNWDITYTIEKINGRWIRTADPPEGEFSINDDLLSELGMTFGELSEKYGSEPKGAFNSYSFEKGYGRYGWKSPDGSVYEDMEQAGGCNMIDGVRVKLLFSGVGYPISFETLEEKGFMPLSIDDEPGMDDCFWASFTHPDYEGVTFTFYTKEYGVIADNESCVVTMVRDDVQKVQEEIQ